MVRESEMRVLRGGIHEGPKTEPRGSHAEICSEEKILSHLTRKEQDDS